MIKTINLKGREITYDLQRKRVKNINLRIKADQSVCVSASSRVSVSVIEGFMRDKADFILRALERYAEIAENAPKPKQYSEGEVFRILGRSYVLKPVRGSRSSVKTDEGFIVLTVKDTEDFELKKRVMDKWFKSRCREIVLEVCESVYGGFQKYGVAFPEIRVRSMTSRWGSCQPKKGILTFNTALAEAPLSCIEYVVTHEFVHFLQPNHSKEFYRLLEGYMPDWRERKRLLDSNNYCGERQSEK